MTPILNEEVNRLLTEIKRKLKLVVIRIYILKPNNTIERKKDSREKRKERKQVQQRLFLTRH